MTTLSRTELARQALRAALAVRSKIGIGHDRPLCVYDAAERLGVEVQFFAADSFNGIFSKNSSTILVPSLRPYGRQAFSCGHELGHWHFGHGTRFELLDGQSSDQANPEEILADIFAGHLLMPPWAMARALKRRSIDLRSASPIDFFRLACQFGVGYETLLNHLAFSCKMLSERDRERLQVTTPKEIREQLVGRREGLRHLTLVDAEWESMPIDLQVGDIALFERRIEASGRAVQVADETSHGVIVVALRPGLSAVATTDKSWSAFVRVSRRDFSGRSIYRHLEDPDVN